MNLLLTLITFLAISLIVTQTDYRNTYYEHFIKGRKYLKETTGDTWVHFLISPFLLIGVFVSASVAVLSNRAVRALNAPAEARQLTLEERKAQFRQTYQQLLQADYNSDESFRKVVAGWNWWPEGLFLHFHQMPEKQELDLVKNHLVSYLDHVSGFKVSGLEKPYLHNFGISSFWTVQATLTDLVTENEARRRVELARVKRESELDYLVSPIPAKEINRPEHWPDDCLPLWATRHGKYKPIKFDNHILLAGATSSGKSNALVYWANLIGAFSQPDDTLFILDYKGSRDWKDLRGVKGYYPVEQAKEGFELAYRQFRAYLDGEEEIGDRLVYVLIDELSSLVESYEKKEREQFLRKLGELLRLSRNIGDGNGGFRLIVGLQQPDSHYFGGTSTRANFGIRVALGGISLEGSRMLFEVTDDSLVRPTSSASGKGYAQRYGQPVEAIIIPYEENRGIALERIRKMLERSLV